MLRLALSSLASLFLLPFQFNPITTPDGSNKSPLNGIYDHCGHIPPISRAEYNARQSALGSALHKLNATAYITEPSPNSQYYANFSVVNWKLSERPLLLIIQPGGNDGSEPDVTLLTPKVRHGPALSHPSFLSQAASLKL